MTDCEHPTYKSVMIHASAVEYQGKALVFLGPSGTGKSTISQLLAGTLDGARVLADDKVYLHAQGDRWMVSDAQPCLPQEAWVGQITLPLMQVPLGAVFRIYQAPLPRLEPVNVSDTCRYLIKAFTEVIRKQPDNLETKKSFFNYLAAVARATPGYEIYSDCSVQTADMLQREMVFA